MIVKSFKDLDVEVIENDIVYVTEETWEEFLLMRKEHRKGKNPKLECALEKANKIEKNMINKDE